MAVFKIKNIDLKDLSEFLLDFDLSAKETRLRTRFVKLLSEYMNRFSEEHYELILKHAICGEDEKPLVVIDGKGNKVYDIKSKEAFNVDYNELLLEDCIIEITEERKEMFNYVKSMILECDKTFKGEEALAYDRYCEMFESVE